jgi:peptidoglycan/LPS O-acetylase OafA/YrhL
MIHGLLFNLRGVAPQALVKSGDADCQSGFSAGNGAVSGPSRQQEDGRHQTFRGTRHFGSLDGLRAISILAVVWYHTSHPTIGTATNRIALLGRGNLGVGLFFAISGFLITTLILRERESYGWVSLRLFYARRTLRIFPLYYTVLLLYAITVFLLDRGSPAGRDFFWNLSFFVTYTSNWFVHLDGRVIFYFAWSLAAEEQFYLVWPWIEKASRDGRLAVGAITAILALNLACASGALDSFLPEGSFARIVLASIAAPICFGVIFAHALHSPSGFRAAAKFLYPKWASVALTAAVLALASIPTAAISIPWLWKALLGLAMAALVAACAIREDHALSSMLSFRPMQEIGKVSYGMYLLHMLCLNVAAKLCFRFSVQSSVALFVATACIAFAAAWLSFNYYESIFMRFKTRFSRPDLAGAAGRSSTRVAGV